MATKITTIKLKSETKARLEKFKVYPSETYEEVMREMLDILSTCRQNPEKARSRLLKIDSVRRKKDKPGKMLKNPFNIQVFQKQN